MKYIEMTVRVDDDLNVVGVDIERNDTGLETNLKTIKSVCQAIVTSISMEEAGNEAKSILNRP